VKRLLSFCLAALALASGITDNNAQANTTVRFRISYGANVLGNIDVELFDQDKPVTVSNFLAYVDSGQYKRTLLHRLEPNFVLQGGAGTLVNPYSFAGFQIINAIDARPAITNEFNVGPLLSNVFGTLAMAKIDDQPNSATSSWFFNLGNNATNLDTQNGGFTVFGRATSGTNLFTTFNSLSKVDNQGNSRGIIDVTDFFSYGFYCGGATYLYEDGAYSVWTGGTDLPVSFLGNYCVRYADALTVDIFRTSGPITDTAAPTVAIGTPLANAIANGSDVTVTGTAADGVGVASVDVILNHSAVFTAAGGTSWSVTLTNVPPGSNTITVVASDAAHNQSKPAFRNFFQRTTKALDLTIVGQGTVTGATNTQVLDLGRIYTVTAKPAAGYIFKEWEGVFDDRSLTGDTTLPTLPFYFRTNTALRAVFVPNPFIPTKGTYNGLFAETNTVHHDRAGYLALILTDRGTYSGKLTLEGKPIAIKGQFNAEGAVPTQRIIRNGSNDLILKMYLDSTNGTCQLTGTVSQLSGSWVSRLVADQARFNIATNPATQAGTYTFMIPGVSGASDKPAGSSYGTVKIDGNGKITLAGSLADGSKLVQKTVLSKDGMWPFFVPLYTGKGLAIGWLDLVTGNPSTDILGDVAWLKIAAAGGTYYPGGFLLQTNVTGSRFVPPATSTTRIVDVPTGSIAFSGGNLPSDFSNAIAISEASVVTSSSPNALTLAFAKPTGLMKGTVVHPNGAPTYKFSGVVLQKQAIAAGYILGTNQSSRVYLSAP
jgi:cyclophilin family peptidyl-prolyl cis-trans isomerase